MLMGSLATAEILRRRLNLAGPSNHWQLFRCIPRAHFRPTQLESPAESGEPLQLAASSTKDGARRAPLCQVLSPCRAPEGLVRRLGAHLRPLFRRA